MAKVKGPSQLSYQRSLVPTDAVFKTVVDGKEVPVSVVVKATLGTQSQYVDEGKSIPAEGNPQRVDAAMLPHNASMLIIEWDLAVIGGAMQPHSCDTPAWRTGLCAFAKDFAETGGFEQLGLRYAVNIANGRWAWKNRLFASSFKVVVRQTSPVSQDIGSFDAFSLPLDGFDVKNHADRDALDALASKIASALAGNGMARFSVRGELSLGSGAIVYPSQEFAEKDEDKSAVKKILYSVPLDGESRCAAFHEQKIGAAIRTVDTWHGGVLGDDGIEIVDLGKPLVINPYAQDRDTHVVARNRGMKHNFYSLLLDAYPDFSSMERDAALFVMANLIRGGVYGMGKSEKNAAKAAAGK